MVCPKKKRFQNSVFNFESTANTKYFCLCKVILFVCFKRKLGTVHFYTLVLMMAAWQRWGLFSTEDASTKLLVLPSVLSLLRKDISEVRCLDCWGPHWPCDWPAAAWCRQAGTSPMTTLPAADGGLRTGNTEHISARSSMCLQVPSCLWCCLWRLQPQEFVTPGLFVNSRSM